MSDQKLPESNTPQAPEAEKPAEAPRPEPKAESPVESKSEDAKAQEAAAALAAAVSAARPKVEAKTPVEPAPAKPAPVATAAAPFAARAPANANDRPSLRRVGLQAAAVAVALGVGFGCGSLVQRSFAQPQTPAWAEQVSAGVARNQDDVLRLAGDLKALKVSVDAVKEGVQRSGGDKGLRQVQSTVVERIEQAEKVSREATTRLVKLAEQIERLEKANADPVRLAGIAERLSGLMERLDRIERQQTAAATAVTTLAAVQAKAPDPEKTGAIVEKKPVDPRTQPVEGWVLRDVYDGVALVENDKKRLHEVGLGGTLPGGLRVEAIERRGKAWVVVTSKGTIGMDRWW